MNPLVSVVVPTYNRRHLIGETLESVLTQSLHDLELIVVDDGSTDGSREFVLDTFGSDSRLKYIVQPNSERAVARNRGIREARGRFLAFLDSDDLWLPMKLERQLAILTRPSAPECCYCFFDVISDDRIADPSPQTPHHGDIFALLLNDCVIGSMTPVVRRSCFDVVGGFCEDRGLLCFEDWEMWTRLSSRYSWDVVPEVLGRYRLHGDNSQHAATVEVDELRLRIMKRYALSPCHKASLDTYSDARTWHWATTLYKTQPRFAIKLLCRLACTNPRHVLSRSFVSLFLRSAMTLNPSVP